MDEVAVRLGVQELIAAYVDCIDEDRLEDWPDFFVEQCRGMLIDRITALRQANIFEPHRYRHIVGPIRIEQVDATVAQVRSNFIAVRIMHDGEMALFAAGRYLDRIALTSQPYRFIERLVVLDSQKIDTLLVIPL
jgi:anthranilate 1,2-dioxygenase small subunit